MSVYTPNELAGTASGEMKTTPPTPTDRVGNTDQSDADCGHPRVGHNDGECCAVCDLGDELDAAIELLEAAVVWSPHVGRCMYPKLDCECWLNPAKAFLETREQPSTSDVFENPDRGMSARPETEKSSSSDVSELEVAQDIVDDWFDDDERNNRDDKWLVNTISFAIRKAKDSAFEEAARIAEKSHPQPCICTVCLIHAEAAAAIRARIGEQKNQNQNLVNEG